MCILHYYDIILCIYKQIYRCVCVRVFFLQLYESLYVQILAQVLNSLVCGMYHVQPKGLL